MAGRRRLPVLQNTDDEVADRPPWQGAAITAVMSLLFWVAAFALVSALLRAIALPLGVAVVVHLLTSAAGSAGATAVARVAVPSMTARFASIGAAIGTLFVFGVASIQTLTSSTGTSLPAIGATFVVLVAINAGAALGTCRWLERRKKKRA